MEDVTKLTKEEFLKFLDCSHHTIKTETILLRGPRNSLTSVVKRFGKFSASNVELEEFSLNKQILRIPLPKVELENLSPGQVAYRFRKQKTEKKRKKNNVVVSRFGRKLKKKQLNIQSLTRSKITRRSLRAPIVAPKADKNKVKFLKQEPKLQEKKPVKSDERKVYSRNMSLPKRQPVPQASQKVHQAQFIPTKPKFIIKYVPIESTYFLKMNPLKNPQDGKLNYSFDTLVKDIKNMKLPSATWKIKVVVKSNKIASIIFTNKCVLERTVTFNAKTEYFGIVIENKPAILLGTPGVVTCVEDIEILLNIIHTISAKDPMVYYKC